MKHLLATTLLCLALCPAFFNRAYAATSKPDSISAAKIEDIKKHIEELRGLSYTSEVKTVFITTESVTKIARKIMTSEGMTPDKIQRMKKVMVAFGLIKNDFDLAAALDSIFSEQLQGLYDPVTKTLYVRNDVVFDEALTEEAGISEMELALSHELGHALQDQRFNLLRISSSRNSNEDAALAFASVAEGDATIIMMDYGMKDFGFSVPNAPMFAKFMESFLFGSGQDAFLKDMPDTIKAQLIFPYTEGMKFVAQVHNSGGWKAVDAALKDPPESTEQLMHPDKYLGVKDRPVSLDLPDISEMLPAGYKKTDTNTCGEFQTALIVSAPMPRNSKSMADSAAAGWDGDRYSLFELDGSPDTLVWMTTWDSPAEAKEFTDAFAKSLEARFSQPAASADTGTFTWKTDCGITALRLADSDTAFIYCATLDSYENIITSLLTQTKKYSSAQTGAAPQENRD